MTAFLQAAFWSNQLTSLIQSVKTLINCFRSIYIHKYTKTLFLVSVGQKLESYISWIWLCAASYHRPSHKGCTDQPTLYSLKNHHGYENKYVRFIIQAKGLGWLKKRCQNNKFSKLLLIFHWRMQKYFLFPSIFPILYSCFHLKFQMTVLEIGHFNLPKHTIRFKSYVVLILLISWYVMEVSTDFHSSLSIHKQ